MEENIFKNGRKSKMSLGEIYFWTNTIKDWKHLLKNDSYKNLIIEQLQWLKRRNKVVIYGLVIMPNHIHVLWEMLEKNGREMPHASFNKWTSNQFLKDLRNQPEVLTKFEENTMERNHRFWQKEALAVHMDCKYKFEQKLEYIHLNPLQEQWNLAKYPEEYRWSSAEFYLSGKNEFDLFTHYMERF